MDAPDALFYIHRVPRQVEIEQYSGELKVDALASCGGTNQDPWAIRIAKAPLRGNLRAMVSTTQHNNPLAGIRFFNLRSKQVDGAEIGGEDDNLLFGISSPERSKRQE